MTTQNMKQAEWLWRGGSMRVGANMIIDLASLEFFYFYFFPTVVSSEVIVANLWRSDLSPHSVLPLIPQFFFLFFFF